MNAPPEDAFEGSRGVSPVRPLKEKKRLGNYELRYELASGGMATVYLGVALNEPSKLVAIKRIHPHLAETAHFVRMFHDEARIASLIEHDNVCGVLDVGDHDGVPFLVMEYLQGESVGRLCHSVASTQKLYSSPDWANVASAIVIEACKGLHAAHELKDARGDSLEVVHRDISPQNLLVTFDGVAKVLDFGIARATHRLQNTQTGELKGKFAYMAPEQLRPKNPIDRRADIWALGVVLWEMLTLRRLFRRSVDTDTLLAVMSDPIPVPSTVWSRVPKDLDQIVMKALARNPADRWSSANEMAMALARSLSMRGYVASKARTSDWMNNAFPGPHPLPLAEGRASVVAPEPAPTAAAPTITTPLGAVPNGSGSSTPAPFATDDESGVRPGIFNDSVDETHGAFGASTTSAIATGLSPKVGWKWPALIIALAAATAGMFWMLGEDPAPIAVSLPQGASLPPSVPAAEASEPLRVSPQDAPTAVAQPAPAQAEEAVDQLAVAVPPPEVPPEAEPETEAVRATTTRSEVNATESNRRRNVRRRPVPVAREATVRQGSGTLNLTTPGGWATVLERGRAIGQTPFSTSLSAGSHRLELRPFGEGPPRFVTVEIEPDQVTRRSVRISE